jgi:hypothetical protein
MALWSRSRVAQCRSATDITSAYRRAKQRFNVLHEYLGIVAGIEVVRKLLASRFPDSDQVFGDFIVADKSLIGAMQFHLWLQPAKVFSAAPGEMEPNSVDITKLRFRPLAFDESTFILDLYPRRSRTAKGLPVWR